MTQDQFLAHPVAIHLFSLLAIFLTAFVIAFVLDLIIYRWFGNIRGILSFVTLLALCAFGVYAMYIY